MTKFIDILVGVLLYIVFHYFTGGFIEIFMEFLVSLGDGTVHFLDIGLFIKAFFIDLAFIVIVSFVVYLASKKVTNRIGKRALDIIGYAVFSSIFIDILFSWLGAF